MPWAGASPNLPYHRPAASLHPRPLLYLRAASKNAFHAKPSLLPTFPFPSPAGEPGTHLVCAQTISGGILPAL